MDMCGQIAFRLTEHAVSGADDVRKRLGLQFSLRMLEWRALRDVQVLVLPQMSPKQVALLALNALQLGEFALIAPRMRAAMRALPAHDREQVGLPVEVWDALTNHVGTAITSGGDLQSVALDDAQAARMGAFWFDVASGRPAEVP